MTRTGFKSVRDWRAFGPQGREIETLLGQVKSLTNDQILAISSAWDAAWGTAQSAALDAAQSAALDSARDAAWSAVWDADWDAGWYPVRDAAWVSALNAAWGAVRGLLVLDLEPDVAEILLTPWVSVMGRSWEVTA